MVAAWSKGRVASDGCQHAAYAWREIRLVDVELNVGGELSLVALRTEIVWTVDPCPTDSREYRAGTHSYVLGRMTTITGQASMVSVRGIKSQQLGDRIGTGLMDRGANRHLHSLQIQLAGAMAIGKDSVKLMF